MGTNTEVQKITAPLNETLNAVLIPNNVIKMALAEFWEWYSQRYTLSVYVDLRTDRLTLHIHYDASEDFEECAFECIEVAKKHAKTKIDKDAVKESCYDNCIYDVGGYFNAMFDEIRSRLFERLNKYGVKYSWEEGWEDESRYLQVDIFLTTDGGRF
jgi:hypothetical protein